MITHEHHGRWEVPPCLDHAQKTSRYSDETCLRIDVDAHLSDSCRPEARSRASNMQWARAANPAFSGSKRTSRTIMSANCGDARTRGSPSNGSSVHWAGAQNAGSVGRNAPLVRSRVRAAATRAPVEPRAMVPACIGHVQRMLRLRGRNDPLVRSRVRVAATRAPVEPQGMVPACIGHVQKMLRLVCRNAPLVRSWVRAAATRAPVEPQAMVPACIGHVQKTPR